MVSASYPTGTICLPYFAADGGHVQQDIPQALTQAGFTGRLLPPLGIDPRVPPVIAQTLLSQSLLALSPAAQRLDRPFLAEN